MPMKQEGKMRQVRRAVMIGILAAAIGGCSQSRDGQWRNDSVPQEQWASDRLDCETAAREQVEREFRPQSQGLSPASSNPAATGGQWSGMMDRFSAERRQTELFDRCMTQRGYRLVPFGQ
jgi:hypothetical protein